MAAVVKNDVFTRVYCLFPMRRCRILTRRDVLSNTDM